ncbi:MAG: proton-conducting transporter transmembrane domain-containing protein [Solirubrobacteraceae bacterium]
MTLVFAIAMSLLAAAPLVAIGLSRVAALLSAAGCALLVLVGLSAALGGAQPVLELGGWLGFGSSALRANGLAGIFLGLAGVTGAAVSLAHAELPAGRWLPGLSSVLLLAVAVTIGSDNAFLFFLAWELLTVCIYLISSADREHPGELLAGYLTGGLAKIGGAALLAAFALLYAHTHSFSLATWTHASLSAGTRGLLFALFLTSFATKVGVVPLQGGLPAGYGAAPRLGAASLSVALCAGFYGLWRFEFQILGPLPVWCGDALLILGGLTAMLGILYALTQDDLRRFLGYSTIEHTGIATVGLGVALLGHAAHQPKLAAAGLLAATLHVCAHNLAKSLALIGVDRVEQATGQRRIDPSAGSPASCRQPHSVWESRH